MKGERMPDPAPCASTSTASESGGSIHMRRMLRVRELARLGPVAVGPPPRHVVGLRPLVRRRDDRRLGLGNLQMAQDVAHGLLVPPREVLVDDRERLDAALAEI